MTRKRKSAALVLLVDVSENSPSKSPNAMGCFVEHWIVAIERLPEFSNRCAEIFNGAGTRLDGCRECLNDKRRPAEWKRSDLSNHKRRRNGGKSESETALCCVGIPVASNAGNRSTSLSLSPRAKSGSDPSHRPRSRANRYSRHPRRECGRKRRSTSRLTHYLFSFLPRRSAPTDNLRQRSSKIEGTTTTKDWIAETKAKFSTVKQSLGTSAEETIPTWEDFRFHLSFYQDCVYIIVG